MTTNCWSQLWHIFTQLSDCPFLRGHKPLQLCTLCWVQLPPVPHPGDRGPRHRRRAGPPVRRPWPKSPLQANTVHNVAKYCLCAALSKTVTGFAATWQRGGCAVAERTDVAGQQAGQHRVVVRFLREAHRPGISGAQHREICSVDGDLLVYAWREDGKTARHFWASHDIVAFLIYPSINTQMPKFLNLLWVLFAIATWDIKKKQCWVT